MAELVQTKNSFKVIGKVTRIDKDGAFREEIATKGKREGDLYRSLRFGVKTSETNEITVQMFDYEPEQVFLWNSEKKKKDSSYRGDRVPFATWESQQDELREQGYAVLQTRIGLEYDENGKIKSKGLPSFVASKEIYENLSNGDSVVVEGSIRYSTWEKDGKVQEQKSYNIEKVFKIKDVDFESEKFEEVTYFEQEMVFVDIDIDEKEGKAYVIGRVIDYAKNFHDTQMVINFKDENGNVDADMKKLADAIKKRIKFGDIINVFGDTINRVIITEEESDEEEVDLFAEFGGKHKPKHAQSYTAKTYINEMSIYGLDGITQGVYTEDDFVKDELVEDSTDTGNPFASEFGGKGKPNFGDDPFGGDTNIEISEDDLPF